MSDCKPRSLEFEPQPGHKLLWNWSWNYFYGHSTPSADSRRAVVSYQREYAHLLRVNLEQCEWLAIMVILLKWVAAWQNQRIHKIYALSDMTDWQNLIRLPDVELLWSSTGSLPKELGFSTERQIGIMQLIDALSACAISTKIDPSCRMWAGIQLVKCLAAQIKTFPSRSSNIDLGSDLPSCFISKLEAHQNRVADCIWSDKKNLLATR